MINFLISYVTTHDKEQFRHYIHDFKNLSKITVNCRYLFFGKGVEGWGWGLCVCVGRKLQTIKIYLGDVSLPLRRKRVIF